MDYLEEELVYAAPEPDMRAISDEFSAVTPFTSGWNRLNDAEATRFCQWANQSADGKKWEDSTGQRIFPYPRASDARVRLCDDVITEIMAFEELAFWRSLLRVEGVEVNDTSQAGIASKLLEWIRGSGQMPELIQEVPKHSSYTHTYGWSVLFVSWLQERQLRMQEISLEQLAQVPVAEGVSLASMVMEPTLDAESVQVLQQIFPQYLKSQGGFTDDIPMPELKPKTARRAIKELRENGKTRLPVPYVCKDLPSIVALKPWVEVIIPNWLTDIQRGPVYIRRFMTEVEIRTRGAMEGWDKEWIEEALKTKGQCSSWSRPMGIGMVGVGRTDTLSAIMTDTLESKLVEVVFRFSRMLDEDDIPGIWMTTFCPSVTMKGDASKDLYAAHSVLDYEHGKMPFICRKREPDADRIVDSRGIPEMLLTDQRGYKAIQDAAIDNLNISVCPPWNYYDADDEDMILRPGQGHLVMSPGREPQFMNVPGNNITWAFEMLTFIEKMADRRFGRLNEAVPPQVTMSRMQLHVTHNNHSWMLAFRQQLSLIAQYMSSERQARITGGSVLPSDAESVHELPDLTLHFDVRELDNDFMAMKLKAVGQLLVADSENAINRRQFATLGVRAIDPTWEKTLIQPAQTASDELVKKVKDDLSGMMNGFEAQYVENDPRAGIMLQVAQQYLQTNPKMQQSLIQDPHFKDLSDKYVKNLQLSVSQQANKQVGLEGVNPTQPQGR